MVRLSSISHNLPQSPTISHNLPVGIASLLLCLVNLPLSPTISHDLPVGISWSGFWCQSLITATAYTVVGVTNKMLTVTSSRLISADLG